MLQNESRPLDSHEIKMREEAVNPQYSCFVSASAGCGKTKLLVDRFVELLVSGAVMPAKILCVTFTNTAADEIKARVLKQLTLLNNTQQEVHQRVYQLFLREFANLKIATIHGFCYDILQNYWRHAGLAPLSIITLGQKAQFISDSLRHAVRMHQDTALLLLKKYEWSYLEDLLKSAIELREKTGHNSFTYPAPEDPCIGFMVCNKLLLQELFGISIESTEELMALLKQYFINQDGTFKKRSPKINGVALDPSTIALFLELHQECNLYQFRLLNNNFTILSECAYEYYTQQKKQLRVLSFDDILYQTLDVLQSAVDRESLLYKLDYQIDHIMVDEAQDTSAIQWQIIKLLTQDFFAGESRRLRPATLFIVGDFKQSIYGFAGADPLAFTEAYKYFSALIGGSQQHFREIYLDYSFRSLPVIMDYINGLFNDPHLSHAISGNDEFRPHKAIKSGVGHVEVFELNAAGEDKLESKEALQALQIFNKVVEDVRAGRMIAGLERICTYNDYMIIFHKRSATYYRLIELFKEAGEVVLANRTLSFQGAKELKLIASILRFAAFPYDDWNLVQMLSSPLFFGDTNIFHQLFPVKEGVKTLDIIQEIAPATYMELEAILILSHLNVTQFLRELFLNGGMQRRFIGLFGIEFINTFNSLLRTIMEATADKDCSILDFICHHLDGFVVNEPFNNNAVGIKIITAHSAKGLEAPIVIIADTTTTDNTPRESLFVDNESGAIMLLPPKAFLPAELQKKLEMRIIYDYCENLRLMYVAVSRAVAELYIFGSKNNRQQNSWYPLLQAAAKEEYRSIAQFYGNELAVTANNDSVRYKLEGALLSEYIPLTASLNHVLFYNMGLLRGEVIHQLLHQLPRLPKEQVKLVLREHQNEEFAAEYRVAVETVERYPDMFYEAKERRILSEVVVRDCNNGHTQKYIIDKLIFEGKKITIIDFKSDRDVEDAQLTKYRQQLYRYRTAIAKIYTDYTIECWLFFVRNGQLLPV